MRVVFVQKFVPHYRLPFFERVRDSLASHGIEFVLIYGSPDPFEDSKVKMEYPEWGIHAKTKHLTVAGRYLYWLGAKKHIRKGDFVVCEHAAKLLDNYLLFALRQFGFLKMGYFGHGQNFQKSTEYKLSSILKSMTLRKVDRWFAYTSVSKDILIDQSVQEEIITVVNNSLKQPDNVELADNEPNECTFAYIGGIYDLKLIPLLLEASSKVAEKYPNFVLHMVGTGPDKHLADTEAKKNDWLKVHGALYGKDRDEIIAASQAILMPGLVGLIAIDSFQFRRPVITSSAGEHSPEIAYLDNEINCLIDDGDDVTAETYANLIIRYLDDKELRVRLSNGCRASADLYSIDNMASNFCAEFIDQ